MNSGGKMSKLQFKYLVNILRISGFYKKNSLIAKENRKEKLKNSSSVKKISIKKLIKNKTQ